tara:strand:- start:1579 stop:2733 length:1155 start_codon:yes stop_codon:yes gene_type:complete
VGLLRLVLAICVFRAHSSSFGIPLLAGDVAVEIFYVLSGFYMQMILSKVYTFSRMGNKWLQKFYINRYLRIFPIYIFTIITALSYTGLKQLFFTEGTKLIPPYYVINAVISLQNTFSNILLKVFLFFTNITIFFQDLIMFIGIKEGNAQLVSDFTETDISISQGLIIPQAFTLGIEISFYLIAPFLLKLSTKKLVAISLLSISLKIIFILLFYPKFGIYNYFGLDSLQSIRNLWGYRFFPFEISYFLVGAISYRFLLESKKHFHYPTFNKRLIAYFLVIISITIVSPILNKDGICWLSPLIFAVFLPSLFNLFKNSKMDRIFGELSYPFYISHLLCLEIMKPLEGIGIKNLSLISSLLLSFGFSLILMIINKRFDLIRERIKAA